MRRLLAILLVIVPTLLTGCAEPGPPEPTASKDSPGASIERAILLERSRTAQDASADFLCLFGGDDDPLDRTPARIQPGHARLEVDITVERSYTGYQLGYAIDDGAVTWLPTVAGERKAFEVPIAADQHEGAGEPRWSFYEQMNLRGAEQECYTGGGVGAFSVVVKAMT